MPPRAQLIGHTSGVGCTGLLGYNWRLFFTVTRTKHLIVCGIFPDPVIAFLALAHLVLYLVYDVVGGYTYFSMRMSCHIFPSQ